MKIALLCADHIDGTPLPGVFAEDRKIEFQSLKFFDHIRLGQAINIEPEHHQRMNKWTICIDLPVLERIDLTVSEQNSVSVLGRREIDPERSRQRHRFVPSLYFLFPILIDV